MNPVTHDLDAMLKRLHLPTIRRLYAELAVRAEQEGLSYRTFLEILIAEEIAHRAQTRITRSVRKAKFPFLRTIEEFDFTFQTSIRLQMLGSFLGPELVSEGRCAILSGPPGRGKSHLGVAIAYRAIQNGFEARFTTADELIGALSRAAAKARLEGALEPYVHPHVLVIDELGYQSYAADAANVLYRVVNDRYLRRRSMIFTTNKPLAALGQLLHDGDLAEAILDRVLERGTHFVLRGPSYRTRHLKRQDETELAAPTRPSRENPRGPESPPEARSSIVRASHRHGAQPASRPAQPPSAARAALTRASTGALYSGRWTRPRSTTHNRRNLTRSKPLKSRKQTQTDRPRGDKV